MRYGVPQGSVLGPLLFLVYINDINESIPSSKVMLFADDTSITESNVCRERLYEGMTESMNSLKDWFRANGLALNETKTETITFGLRELENDESTDGVKFLGILLDSTLKFDSQVDQLALRLSKTIFLLKNLKNVLPRSCLVQAFHGVFQSVACYGILAWGHSAHTARIFALQRRAIRVLAGLDYRADTRQTYRELRVMTIPCRYIYECLIYCHKNINKYNLNNFYHNYPTRQADYIRIDHLRLQKSRISVNYYCPKFYNNLPTNLREQPEKTFKINVKEFLISNAFFSAQEFLDFTS